MRVPNAAHHDRPTGAEDDPIDHDIWVPARQAALVLAKPERWLRDECRAGHLPCHGEPKTGQVFLVPMTATEELAEELAEDLADRPLGND
jgi:hypothetical protein